MKRIKLMTTLLAVAAAVVITGCSKNNADSSSEPKLVELDQQTVVTSEEKETSEVTEKESVLL